MVGEGVERSKRELSERWGWDSDVDERGPLRISVSFWPRVAMVGGLAAWLWLASLASWESCAGNAWRVVD